MATVAHNHLLPIMPTPPAIVTANPIDSRRILKRGRKRNDSVRLSRCLKYGNWNELTWSGHIWCRRMKKTWKRGLGSQPGVWGWVTRRNFNLHRFIEMRTLRLVQDCVISRYDRANSFNYNRGAKFKKWLPCVLSVLPKKWWTWKRKLNSEERKSCYYVWSDTFLTEG